jgi:uncharacterized protein YbbK (DUF523 family)
VKVALSACLIGHACRYDATDNYHAELLELLDAEEIVTFCPEDHAFGSPRPTMDLVQTDEGVRALSNLTGDDLSPPVWAYADAFFDVHTDIDLFIGKDRSPSCGVRSAKLYDAERNLLTDQTEGLMANRAMNAGIESWDAEDFVARISPQRPDSIL